MRMALIILLTGLLYAERPVVCDHGKIMRLSKDEIYIAVINDHAYAYYFIDKPDPVFFRSIGRGITFCGVIKKRKAPGVDQDSIIRYHISLDDKYQIE